MYLTKCKPAVTSPTGLWSLALQPTPSHFLGGQKPLVGDRAEPGRTS